MEGGKKSLNTDKLTLECQFEKWERWKEHFEIFMAKSKSDIKFPCSNVVDKWILKRQKTHKNEKTLHLRY